MQSFIVHSEANQDKSINQQASSTKINFFSAQLQHFSVLSEKINDIKQLSKKLCQSDFASLRDKNQQSTNQIMSNLNKLLKKIKRQSQKLKQSVYEVRAQTHNIENPSQVKFQEEMRYRYQQIVSHLIQIEIQSQQAVQKGQNLKKSKQIQNSSFVVFKHRSERDTFTNGFILKSNVIKLIKKQLEIFQKLKCFSDNLMKNQNLPILQNKRSKLSQREFEFKQKQQQHYKVKSCEKLEIQVKAKSTGKRKIMSDLKKQSQKRNIKSEHYKMLNKLQKLIFQKQLLKLKVRNQELEKNNMLLTKAIQQRQKRSLLKYLKEKQKNDLQEEVLNIVHEHEQLNRNFEQRYSTCNMLWLKNSEENAFSKYYLTKIGKKIKEEQPKSAKVFQITKIRPRSSETRLKINEEDLTFRKGDQQTKPQNLSNQKTSNNSLQIYNI